MIDRARRHRFAPSRSSRHAVHARRGAARRRSADPRRAARALDSRASTIGSASRPSSTAAARCAFNPRTTTAAPSARAASHAWRPTTPSPTITTLPCRTAEHGAEQRAAAAVELREVVRADERRHRARDRAHRREQRQPAALVLHGLVRDRRRAAREQRLGQCARRAREMKVGEHDLTAELDDTRARAAP